MNPFNKRLHKTFTFQALRLGVTRSFSCTPTDSQSPGSPWHNKHSACLLAELLRCWNLVSSNTFDTWQYQCTDNRWIITWKMVHFFPEMIHASRGFLVLYSLFMHIITNKNNSVFIFVNAKFKKDSTNTYIYTLLKDTGHDVLRWPQRVIKTSKRYSLVSPFILPVSLSCRQLNTRKGFKKKSVSARFLKKTKQRFVVYPCCHFTFAWTLYLKKQWCFALNSTWMRTKLSCFTFHRSHPTLMNI